MSEVCLGIQGTMGVTSVEHRGAQCLLTLARSLKPPLGSVPSACVLVCSLYIKGIMGILVRQER